MESEKSALHSPPKLGLTITLDPVTEDRVEHEMSEAGMVTTSTLLEAIFLELDLVTKHDETNGHTAQQPPVASGMISGQERQSSIHRECLPQDGEGVW